MNGIVRRHCQTCIGKQPIVSWEMGVMIGQSILFRDQGVYLPHAAANEMRSVFVMHECRGGVIGECLSAAMWQLEAGNPALRAS